MIESQSKRHKAMTEFERERDQKFFEFKHLGAEKNREHELKIAQLFASASQSVHSGGQIYSKNFHQPSYQNPSLPIYPNMSIPLFTRRLEQEYDIASQQNISTTYSRNLQENFENWKN